MYVMYLYLCGACVCTGAHVCVPMPMEVKGQPQIWFHSCLSLPWCLPNRQDWLTSTWHQSWLYYVGSGDELRFSCMKGDQFTHRAPPTHLPGIFINEIASLFKKQPRKYHWILSPGLLHREYPCGREGPGA